MRKTIAILFAALAAFISIISPVVAAELCTRYRAWLGSSYSDWYYSMDALGNYLVSYTQSSRPLVGINDLCDRPITWSVGSVSGGNVYMTGTYSSCSYVGDGYPSGTYPGGTTAVTYGVSSEQGECENTCLGGAGQSKILNFTVGYSRDPGTDTRMAVVVDRPWERQGQRVCFGGCEFTIGSPDSAWWSKAPTSSGLYRGSMDMHVTQTESQCGSDDPAVSQQDVGGPSCPGDVMQVGGKPVCTGAAGPETPMPGGTPNNGNPPAGNAGSGGTGPGRTPSAGGGGPEGGPGGATGGGASGTKDPNGNPTGTITKPGEGEEQAACGAPGQPPCRIDETGTPRDGNTRFDAAGSQVDSTKQSVLDAITAHKDLTAPAWSWTFQFPSGCTPYAMPVFEMSIDVCEWQDVIHDLMSLVWIGATIWGCIALVGRTVGAPA